MTFRFPFSKSRPTPPEPFTPPDWSGTDPAVHLEKLRGYAEFTINNELGWYIAKKRGRSTTSQRLRFLAVTFTVLGGLVPLVIALFGDRPAWLPAAFAGVRFGQAGYLLLALAAGFVLLDRYFGYSTGWMRYIVAMQSIEKAREAFRLDWIMLLRRLKTSTPQTPEHQEAIEKLIERARATILEVKEHSEKETQAWILEFQTNLAQFEKDLKAQIEASRPGGIDVDVVDGNRADSQIELSLDGMLADRFKGNAGSIGFVAPGLHRVSARAKKSDRDYGASTLVNVGAGQICQVKLTLQIPA